LNLIRVMPAKGQDIAMPTSNFLARLIGPTALVLAAALFAQRPSLGAVLSFFGYFC
jgi:hypothetical protein